MKKTMHLILSTTLTLCAIGVAQAAPQEPDVPNSFQGTWVNEADAGKRAQYCNANIENVDYASAKDLYIIHINDKQIIHDHFNANGKITHIVHDNFRYRTHTENNIRGVSRREYFADESNTAKSRIYKAYSFNYQLQNNTLKSTALNNKTFYPCA